MFTIKQIEPIQMRRQIFKYAVVDASGNELSYHRCRSEAREAISKLTN